MKERKKEKEKRKNEKKKTHRPLYRVAAQLKKLESCLKEFYHLFNLSKGLVWSILFFLFRLVCLVWITFGMV